MRVWLEKMYDKMYTIGGNSFLYTGSFKFNVNWRKISLEVAFLQFFLSMMALWYNNVSMNSMQTFVYVYSQDWCSYTLGFDAVSLMFMILTSMMYMICILLNWNLKYKVKEYLACLFLMNILLMNVFFILDLFLFYVYFESILIPMFLLIGVWGASARKMQAAYKFFLYTLFGSLFMLLAMLNLYFHLGSCDFSVLEMATLSDISQMLMCFCLMMAFAVKVPMFPLHLWLPEAHVEASTAGSVMLAGMLLKLGTYAILSFMMPIFPLGFQFWSPLVFLFSMLGMLYSSLACLRQVDLKKMVAYSSMAHMNFVVLGLFGLTFQALEGSLFLMFSHGLMSSGLFICVGFIYDSYKTSIMVYYSGLAQMMPLFSVVFFLFILGNMSFPGFSSFVGEFLIIMGTFMSNNVAAVLGSLTMVLSAAYSLWFYNSVVFTKLKPSMIMNFCDLTKSEFFIVLPLLMANFMMGLHSAYFSSLWYGLLLNMSYL